MTTRHLNEMVQDTAVVIGVMVYLAAVFACLMGLLMAIAAK